ncbi:conserved hypothetical protein [Ricinus communis]|uniref:Uncharacterized protein n=1 Tax=Ricinus communis TaxID=3988 RepID=B9RWG3_RICCO|nr:conserved hypothetical protein [Ricinus communis]
MFDSSYNPPLPSSSLPSMENAPTVCEKKDSKAFHGLNCEKTRELEKQGFAYFKKVPRKTV